MLEYILSFFSSLGLSGSPDVMNKLFFFNDFITRITFIDSDSLLVSNYWSPLCISSQFKGLTYDIYFIHNLNYSMVLSRSIVIIFETQMTEVANIELGNYR